MPSTTDLIVVLIFAVLFPALSAYSYPKMKLVLARNLPGVRSKAYMEAMTWLWLLATLAAGNWIYQDRELIDLGLGWNSQQPFWTSLVLVAIAAAYLLRTALRTNQDSKLRSRMLRKIHKVKEILPINKREFQLFIPVSITAGICEEFLFRAYLLWFLQQQLNPVLAVLIASLLFGLAHSYQGIKGCFQTMAIGMVLCGLYLYSGSLWPCILLHALIDVYAGYVGWKVLAENASSNEFTEV
ncbi:MAG: CPBP family intramembrane metalloprotease [Gammaproteobacteria bacterium]|nr:CPBP family intramembrane metalloprotease [Gammaproteobacteria bacterium]MDH5799762.1 CPBP family intramembrane metalloprotease [Gammaproteobacteria bacterium]